MNHGMIHPAWPDHWEQIEKDHVPVITQVALLIVPADSLEDDK